ncbi:MAG: hypothetical protein WC845_00520 [Candidatus Staskawiczbacteria bacterium]
MKEKKTKGARGARKGGLEAGDSLESLTLPQKSTEEAVAEEVIPAHVDHDPKGVGVTKGGVAAQFVAETSASVIPAIVPTLNLLRPLNVKSGIIRAQKVIEYAAQVEEWVLNTAMPSLDDFRTMPAPAREMKNPETDNTFAVDARQMQDLLDRYLAGEEGAMYLEAAWVGFYKYHLRREMPSFKKANAMFAELVKEHRLEEVVSPSIEGDLPGGKFRDTDGWNTIGGKRYNFVARAKISPENVKVLRGLWQELNQKIWACEREEWDKHAANLLRATTVTLAEVLEGRDGFYILRALKKTDRDGTTIEGGVVLLNHERGCSVVVDWANDSRGFGQFARRMEAFKENGLFFKPGSLFSPYPPSRRYFSDMGFSDDQISLLQKMWFVHNDELNNDPLAMDLVTMKRTEWVEKHPPKSRPASAPASSSDGPEAK